MYYVRLEFPGGLNSGFPVTRKCKPKYRHARENYAVTTPANPRIVSIYAFSCFPCINLGSPCRPHDTYIEVIIMYCRSITCDRGAISMDIQFVKCSYEYYIVNEIKIISMNFYTVPDGKLGDGIFRLSAVAQHPVLAHFPRMRNFEIGFAPFVCTHLIQSRVFRVIEFSKRGYVYGRRESARFYEQKIETCTMSMMRYQ